MPILELAGELCCPNEGVGSSADGVLELAELAAFCGELSLIGLFACRLEVNGGSRNFGCNRYKPNRIRETAIYGSFVGLGNIPACNYTATLTRVAFGGLSSDFYNILLEVN